MRTLTFLSYFTASIAEEKSVVKVPLRAFFA
jgi:hypothetical protein